MGVKPAGIEWKFGDEKVVKGGDYEASYTLKMGATPSDCRGTAYDTVFNADQWVLMTTTDSITRCYLVDLVSETRLVLFDELRGKYFSFKRKD